MTIVVVILLDLILLASSDDAKEKIYWIIGWSVRVAGMGGLLFLGGRASSMDRARTE